MSERSVSARCVRKTTFTAALRQRPLLLLASLTDIQPPLPVRAVMAELVLEEVSPIAPSPSSSPRQPVPTRHMGRRTHHNFTAANAAGPIAVLQPPPSAYPPSAAPPAPPPGGPPGDRYHRRAPVTGASQPPHLSLRPISAAVKRRPASALVQPQTLTTFRAGSAPGMRPASKAGSRPSTAGIAGTWFTPDESLLRTPIAPRQPAAEELQHELTMTATVLRSAQSRLAEEREQRLRARAAEELALVDARHAKEEARAIRNERRDSDRQLTKALMQQRKELEAQLQKTEDEKELQVAEAKVEAERQALVMRREHEEHVRDLEDQLQAAKDETARVLEDHEEAHKAQREQELCASAESVALAERDAARRLEEERDKRVQHLQSIGVRRLCQQGLARGWTAWLDQYREYTRQLRLLKVRARGGPCQCAGTCCARARAAHTHLGIVPQPWQLAQLARFWLLSHPGRATHIADRGQPDRASKDGGWLQAVARCLALCDHQTRSHEPGGAPCRGTNAPSGGGERTRAGQTRVGKHARWTRVWAR